MTKKPDEIMAEYLLNGAKMLSELCPKCGAPMFEVKGKKMCVVCKDTEKETSAPKTDAENIRVIVPKYAQEQTAQTQNKLTDELDSLILEFCRRAREEKEPSECRKLMECIRTAAEAKIILSR